MGFSSDDINVQVASSLHHASVLLRFWADAYGWILKKTQSQANSFPVVVVVGCICLTGPLPPTLSATEWESCSRKREPVCVCVCVEERQREGINNDRKGMQTGMGKMDE